MPTILFNEIIFGPIHSRRLGSSLGVNLLPYDGKLCSFDCIYCECGFNKDFRTHTKLPNRANVKAAMEDKMQALKKDNILVDVITFAGNGEPTMHPEFEGIVDDTIILRDMYFPECEISVLTNGMHTDKDSVVRALDRVDKNILKLDSAFDETVHLIDRPNSPSYTVRRQVERYKQFKNSIVIQTMFLRGEFEGTKFDNTSDIEVTAWLELIKELKPREVMIYTIDRATPAKDIEKVPLTQLREIADRVEALGIKTNVAG